MAEFKNLKKGDVVILRAFTGMAIGKKTVAAVDAKTITIEASDGEQRKFSKKTGIQIEPAAKAERFANYITEDDGSYEKELAERKAKKASKASTKKKAAPKKEEPDDEETIKPKKEKKSTKKSEPEPEPDDDDEEDDDDDYEEVE